MKELLEELNKKMDKILDDVEEHTPYIPDEDFSYTGHLLATTVAPVAREAGELAGGGTTHEVIIENDEKEKIVPLHNKSWSWEVPGCEISISIDYNKNLLEISELNDFTDMVDEFIDESLEVVEDTITDLQRYRRQRGK